MPVFISRRTTLLATNKCSVFLYFLHYKSTTSTCQLTGGSLHHNCTNRKVESLYFRRQIQWMRGQDTCLFIFSLLSIHHTFADIHNPSSITSPAVSEKNGIALLGAKLNQISKLVSVVTCNSSSKRLYVCSAMWCIM